MLLLLIWLVLVYTTHCDSELGLVILLGQDELLVWGEGKAKVGVVGGEPGGVKGGGGGEEGGRFCGEGVHVGVEAGEKVLVGWEYQRLVAADESVDVVGGVVLVGFGEEGADVVRVWDPGRWGWGWDLGRWCGPRHPGLEVGVGLDLAGLEVGLGGGGAVRLAGAERVSSRPLGWCAERVGW